MKRAARILPRSLRRLAVALAVSLPALASGDPDTLEVASPTIGVPVVVAVPYSDVVPPYGDLHVAYAVGRQLRHAWRASGAWQVEDVPPADTALTYDLTANYYGRELVAYLRNGGRVVVADRMDFGWVVDTVVTWPGATSASPTYSVAMDPGTGEAALALAAQRDGRNRLYLARRASPVWTVTEVDSTLDDLAPPSLVFDPSGRAHIAATGTAPGVSHGVVTVWDEVAPGGAFVSAAVDTEGFTSAVIAWDAVRAQPRVAYVGETVLPGPSWDRTTRYAWRGPGGAWSHQDVSSLDLGSNLLIRTSLALDRFGNPGVTWIHATAIAPNRAEAAAQCGTVDTYHLYLSRQLAGDPSVPFETDEIPFTYPYDIVTSARAVAATGDESYEVAWKTPRIVSCPPYSILAAEYPPSATAVPPAAPRSRPSLSLGPNPVAAGAALRVRWSQAGPGEARLVLHDVAGRSLARLDAGDGTPGAHELAWSPGALRPGCYWVTLRVGGAAIDRRMLVVR